MKVVVALKVTSTDKMNEAFKEKDDKYREWATSETRENEVSKVVMCPSSSPVIERSTRTLPGGGRTLLRTSRMTGCGWPRTCSGTMW